MVMHLMGRQVSCLLGLKSCCAQLPFVLVQMHSGCQATGGSRDKGFFQDALPASGLTFRDVVYRLFLCDPFHCVPTVVDKVNARLALRGFPL